MGESGNGSDTDNTNLAREIFQKVTDILDNAIGRELIWEIFVPSTVTSGTDGLSHEGQASTENEDTDQQHLISSVMFRWIEGHGENDWELENVWDNVSVSQLDDIGHKPNCEWRPQNYSGQTNIEAAMAENINIVLLRMIVDWGHFEGYVWSQQVVWSGSFPDCHRVLQLLENDSNSANSIELIVERYVLNPHFRDEFFALYRNYPLAAAMAVVDSSQTVIVPAQLIGIDDGDGDRLICAICHERLSTGGEIKRLLCSHVFHGSCICSWFYSKLECPLCRKDFRR